jgi:glutathione peroxidase-family protein
MRTERFVWALSQEPATDEQIKQFVEDKYQARFKLFSKSDVNGPSASALWQRLRKTLGKPAIKWNFEKILVDTRGVPMRWYGSDVPPLQIEKDIAWLLAQKGNRQLSLPSAKPFED